MKLRKDDEVMVMAGKDKGKTGKVLSVFPAENKVLVENLNVIKRATKPSSKNPRGGILEVTKPIDASKLMVLDPETKLPARIGYTFAKDGSKERIFKVSPNREAVKKTAKPAADKTEAKAKPAAKKPAKTGEKK
jgi:large subunit ribosomal protein L24